MNITDLWYIVQGAGLSLQILLISIVLGGCLGTLFACIATSKFKLLKNFVNAYISVFRGTPVLVQLSLFYFALPSLLPFDYSAFTAAVITLSLNSTAYICEILRGSLQSIPKAQHAACHTLGIGYFHKMKDIILPQAFRISFPALTSEVICLLKETALISVIGELEIMRRAKIIASEHYTYFGPLLTAALTYYILVVSITLISKKIEKFYSIQQA